MSPLLILFGFFGRLLGGLLCGGLLYAGVAVSSVRNDDGERPPWSWAGLIMIGVVVLIYIYDLGLAFQIVLLVKFSSRLGAAFVIVQVSSIIVGLLGLTVGYIWGWRVYQNEYRAALERGPDFGRSGPAATA